MAPFPGLQAEAVGRVFAARLRSRALARAVSTQDLRGVSDRAQKEAAKVLEFTFATVKGGRPG